MNIMQEVIAMEQMTVDQLQNKYLQVCGEQPRSRNRQWLIKRIAWRMQANEEGDLSERAWRRAKELANDADLRVTAPREPKPIPDAANRTATKETQIRPRRQLLPGTLLKRDYKGRTYRVQALAEGFEWEGEKYKSLTAVAQAITGKHWNGHHFFGLRQKKEAK